MPIANSPCSRSQMIRLMMAVNAVQHLDAHAEKSRRLPFVDARLHEPSRCRVPQGVWSDFAVQLRLLDGALEGRLYGFDGLSVPLNEMAACDSFFFPAPKVREEPRRNGNRRLALVGLAPAFGKPIIYPALEIDEGTTCTSIR